jgi:hypothetical protein
MPVILVTQEAEIRRMAVQSQQIVCKILSRKTTPKKSSQKRTGIGPEFKLQYCKKY